MSPARWSRARRVGLPSSCSCSEDVPNENVVFDSRGTKSSLSTSHVSEGVSGETLMLADSSRSRLSCSE
eukprot:3538390-Pyramimonas_sp.AAC.2